MRIVFIGQNYQFQNAPVIVSLNSVSIGDKGKFPTMRGGNLIHGRAARAATIELPLFVFGFYAMGKNLAV